PCECNVERARAVDSGNAFHAALVVIALHGNPLVSPRGLQSPDPRHWSHGWPHRADIRARSAAELWRLILVPCKMSLLTAITLLTLVSSYIGVRLLPALSLGPVGLSIAITVLCVPVALAAASMLARWSSRRRLARLLTWSGSLTLGWVSSLLLLTLLR